MNSLQLESMLDSALPELYAAVVVFAVKARAYFEAGGMSASMKYFWHFCTNSQLVMKKAANLLKPFDIEFQPFIQEIDAKEMAIQRCADAATMERIRSTCNLTYGVWIQNSVKSNTGIYIDIKHDLREITSQLNGWLLHYLLFYYVDEGFLRDYVHRDISCSCPHSQSDTKCI